jgi:hypothetical protein
MVTKVKGWKGHVGLLPLKSVHTKKNSFNVAHDKDCIASIYPCLNRTEVILCDDYFI